MVPFCTALTVARLLHTRSFSTLLGRVGQRLSASPHPRNALLTAGSCRRRQRHLMATSAPAASGSITPDLLLALAIPPVPGYEFEGARVEHMLAPREGRLSELITEGMALPKGAAELLLRFGAIHTCPVPPALPAAVLEGASPEKAQQLLGRRAAALKRAGNSSQARTPQRTTEDVIVSEHAYIRVHLHPKRFPATYSVDWAARIVANTDEFVVVCKPPGVPAAATVDNLLECAPTCAAQAIGRPTALLVTHRLDQCTEGVLVLGKTRAFVQRFNELVKLSSGSGGSTAGSTASSSSDLQSAAAAAAAAGAEGGGGEARGAGSPQPAAASTSQQASSERPLRKFYRAATPAPPPLGLLRHHLSIERRQVGLPTFTVAHEQAVEGSLPAELRVLEVAPIRLSEAAAQQWGRTAGSTAHECVIELLTGRTHQIRAQLSAVGAPLLGDSLYQPLASAQLRQRLFEGDPCEDLRHDGGRLLDEPAGGIGLQACRLQVTDACMGGSPEQPAVFDAGTPWWRLPRLPPTKTC